MKLRLPTTLTIRTRLLLAFVCVVVATAGAIILIADVIQARDARARVVGQLRSVATLKEQQVASWTDGLRLNLDVTLSSQGVSRDLSTLGTAPPGSPAYAAAYRRIRARFAWVARHVGLFEELFFLGPDGEVLISTEKDHEGQQLGMNDFFTRGSMGDFIQEPSYSLALGEMTVVASRPVSYDDRPAGVLAGRANLDSLNRLMLGRAGLGDTGETYLVGSNHRLLTGLRRPGHRIPNAYVRTTATYAAVDANRDGSGTYRGYAGDRVIGVYQWIPRLRVALLAEQGEAEALSATRLALWTTGGVALLATAIAIIVGTLLIHGITRPLSDLGDTAGRIAAGELDLHAPVRRRDEIGKLAGSFNLMTDRLRGLVVSLEKRSDHLRAINEAGRQISSILELEELLPHVARTLLETFDYECVRILLLDEQGEWRLFSCGRDACRETVTVDADALLELPALAMVRRTGEPLLLTSAAAEAAVGSVSSEVAVPIRIGGGVGGVLDITSGPAHVLDEQDLTTAGTLADQLAVAVENTRLYHNAHELAASKERQRLARDLHDAVSQTLFSVSLIAEVLPLIYEKDPAQGRQRLDELRQLTRGALAEMRMLLLELRPAAMAETRLPDLLRQLSEAVIGRARIPVDVKLDDGVEAPPEVGVALYRIAQEALNNVAKHSGAGRAEVTLSRSGDEGRETIELVVTDDGCGFDVHAVGAGRLGLGIMAERAESIGAGLTVESTIGSGTVVRVAWPGRGDLGTGENEEADADLT